VLFRGVADLVDLGIRERQAVESEVVTVSWSTVTSFPESGGGLHDLGLYEAIPPSYDRSHNMSVFEILMLVCFGAAWPFSIYKSLKSREVGSKSLLFLFVILMGYVAGVLHKVFFYYDRVIFLYGLNATMVLIDILLTLRNRMRHVRESLRGSSAPTDGRSPEGGDTP
jgi:hypothetical protein